MKLFYAVKFQYDTPTSMKSYTEIVPFADVKAAVAVFNPLMIARPYGDTVRVRSKQTNEVHKIEVIDAWLYQADVGSLDEMVGSVKNETATLIDWSGALDDMDEA